MSTPLRPLLAALLLGATGAPPALAQAGVRFIFWHAETVKEEELSTMYGIGFDRDLNLRMSMGLEVMASIEDGSYTFRYRSAYHFTDTDEDGGSAYFGPMLALRSVDAGTDNVLLFPVGARLGYRGTLPGTYLDLYGGVQYQAGAVTDKDSPMYVGAAPLCYLFGLDLGIGWHKRKER